MNNKSAKKRNSANTRPNRRARRRVNRRRVPTAGLTRAVCSIVDPFCQAAKGSRWPDGSTAPSIGYTVEGLFPVVTDANGNAARLLTGTWDYGSAPATVSGLGVATLGSASTYAGVSALTDAMSVRLVSGGIQVESIASMMNSQGFIRIMEAGGSEDITGDYATFDCTSFAYPAQRLKPLKDPGALSAIFRPGGPGSRDYYNAIGGNATTHDWSVLLVSVQGAQASTPVALIKYILHYELKLNPGSLTSRLARPAPAPNSLLTNVADSVSRVTGGVMEGLGHHIEDLARATVLGYIMGGPPGAAAAGVGTLLTDVRRANSGGHVIEVD